MRAFHLLVPGLVGLGIACAAVGDTAPTILGEWSGTDDRGNEISMTFTADSLTMTERGSNNVVRIEYFQHMSRANTYAIMSAGEDNMLVVTLNESGALHVFEGGESEVRGTLQRVNVE